MAKDDIKFGIAFSVSNEMLDDVRDPQHFIQHKKQRSYTDLGKMLEDSKPNLWKESDDFSTRAKIFETNLVIFTASEFKEFCNQLINNTKAGMYDKES